MMVAELLTKILYEEFRGKADIPISALRYDSRKAGKGSLFFAIKGERTDGNRHITDALKRGARGVVSVEPMPADFSGDYWIKVTDDRRAMAEISHVYFGEPSEHLHLTGVTGTNGKTTTAGYLESVYAVAGMVSGSIGTIDYRIGDRRIPAARTTPEAPDIQKYLRELVNRGAGFCVMEVSSHGLALKRVDKCRFGTAIFTNLSRDHLDYHDSMDEYFRIKSLLFSELSPDSNAVINFDDKRGIEILSLSRARTLTYGFHPDSDMRIRELAADLDGSRFKLTGRAGELELETSLPGKPNVYNASAAACAALAQGFDPAVIERGIASLPGVRGRFEKIPNDRGITVIVDFAHTDGALENLLKSVRELMSGGRIITVFGCGGDRDRGKRSLMGKAAGSGSDMVVLTSDNPRDEDPDIIFKDTEPGIRESGTEEYYVIKERKEAIRKAIGLAADGDTVVIAGKGHENLQIIGSRRIEFDDRKTAEEILKEPE